MKTILPVAILSVVICLASSAHAQTTKCRSITSQSTCNNTAACTWHTKKGICIPR